MMIHLGVQNVLGKRVLSRCLIYGRAEAVR